MPGSRARETCCQKLKVKMFYALWQKNLRKNESQKLIIFEMKQNNILFRLSFFFRLLKSNENRPARIEIMKI